MTYLYRTIPFLFLCVVLQAQVLRSPIDKPFAFSGGFAELRNNHFHSGLDYRTGGVTGKPIYAIQDAYVARVGVSPSGYGHVLYLNHADGTTSVYAHLERFVAKIDEYVKNEQYKNESFAVSLYPDESLLAVKKGDIIAWSGNTGSSGGPHLHFEIRDTKTENPLNPVFYSLGITDNSAPEIVSLYVYPLDSLSHVNGRASKKRFDLLKKGKDYSLKNPEAIQVFGRIGFGIEAYDRFSSSDLKCGIYSAELKVDEEDVFGFRMDRLSFDFGRASNAHADYEERVKNRRWVNRLFLLPGNKMDIYQTNENKGILHFSDKNTHAVDIIVKDAMNNASRLKFNLAVTEEIAFESQRKGSTLFKYNKLNEYSTHKMQIILPREALYQDVSFEYNNLGRRDGLYSDIHQLHYNTEPIHSMAELSIRTENLPEKLAPKALIVQIDPVSGKMSGIGGKYDSPWMTAEIRQFGNYAVTVDTIPPRITSLTIKQPRQLIEKTIRFKISDDLSGIKSYRGEIDGAWALFEYDAKTASLTYNFDQKRLQTGKTHDLKLIVTDNRDNISEYRTTFYK